MKITYAWKLIRSKPISEGLIIYHISNEDDNGNILCGNPGVHSFGFDTIDMDNDTHRQTALVINKNRTCKKCYKILVNKLKEG